MKARRKGNKLVLKSFIVCEEIVLSRVKRQLVVDQELVDISGLVTVKAVAVVVAASFIKIFETRILLGTVKIWMYAHGADFRLIKWSSF